MIRLNKIILIILILLIFISGCLYSCEYNDLGLFNTVVEENDTSSVNNAAEELDINSKDFFLESKEKQMDKNPLSDINVRKAIFYAIDRERIVKELFGEYGEVLNSLFEKNSGYYYSSWSEYNYDPEKAKEFLNKTGYGIDNPLYITIGSISDNSTKQMIEEMIKEDLSKIGIKIWIFNKTSEEWYRDCVGKGDYELGIWSIYNFDGSSLSYNFSSEKIPPLATEENKNCENFYWYKNTEADVILENIANENNIERKKELTDDFQDILANDAVILPLYSRIYAIAYNNKKIKNMDISVKNNKIFFNIEKWNLYGEEQTDEDKTNEIIIGFEGEDYEPANLFSSDYISDLLMKGLWEINENGEYENVLVETDSSPGNNLNSAPNQKVKVVLKDGIFWEDGNPITSEDVKYTYDVVLKNENILNIDEDYSKVGEIEVINEKEFNIIFKDEIKNWKKLFGFIFPKGSLDEKDINNFSVEDIVASGPYRIDQYVSGEYLLLKKNDYYFRETPDMDNIKILFDTDINNLISMLKDKEIDLLSIPFNLDLIKGLDENKDFNLLIKSGDLLEHLAVCLKPKEK